MSSHEKKTDKYIPSWDGSPETWEEFEVEVDLFCRRKPAWQEAQQIASLLSALKGTPKSLHLVLSEKERAKITTKEIFKKYLKGNLLETSVPELGRNLRAWQKLRRLPKEGMRIYILRHRQLLSKLERSVNESEVAAQLQLRLRKMVDDFKAKKVLYERAEKLKREAKAKKKRGSDKTSVSSKGSGKSSKAKAKAKAKRRAKARFYRNEAGILVREVMDAEEDWEEESGKTKRNG